MIEGRLWLGTLAPDAIQGITGIPLGILTPSALLGLVVFMLLTGKIVPRSALEDKQQETNRWREAYEAEKLARSISEQKNSEFLEAAKTTNAVLEATFGSGRQETGS